MALTVEVTREGRQSSLHGELSVFNLRQSRGHTIDIDADRFMRKLEGERERERLASEWGYLIHFALLSISTESFVRMEGEEEEEERVKWEEREPDSGRLLLYTRPVAATNNNDVCQSK